MTFTLVQKDALGLFVEFGPWMVRPITPVSLQEGQEVYLDQLHGVAVALRSEGADSASLPSDVWLRCGYASNDHETNQRNFEHCKRFRADVLAPKAIISHGKLPSSGGNEKTPSLLETRANAPRP